MATQHEPQEQVIGTFDTPKKGVWRTLPIHQLPNDALYDAQNVILRNGELVRRPGIQLFDSARLPTIPNGMIEYIDAGNTRVVLVAGRDKIVHSAGSGWSDVTNALVFGATRPFVSRMTTLEFGTPGVVYAVITNGLDPPMQWALGQPTTLVQGVGSSVFKDVITVADRIVAVLHPYSIIWGGALSLTSWAASNTRILADTSDPIVAIRNLGTLGFAIYKVRTIWAAHAQGGPDSSAFRFELRGYFEGPAGVGAIVDAQGAHFYMTRAGRIGRFTGAQHEWVAEGLWPHTRALVDPANIHLAVGAYDPGFHELYFFYPRLGDGGKNNGIVAINLPHPKAGIVEYAAFPGETSHNVTAAAIVRSGNIDAPFVGTEGGPWVGYLQAERLSDIDAAFDCHVQTGLLPTPKLDIMTATVEPFLLRGEQYSTVDLQVVSSNNLDTVGGTLGDTLPIDLTDVPVRDIRAYQARARFFGLKLTFSSRQNVHYFGSLLTGRRLA